MPSGGPLHYRRRLKIVLLLLLLAILISLYVSSSARSTQTSDFYTRTKSALENRLQNGADGNSNSKPGSGSGAADAAARALEDLGDKIAKGAGVSDRGGSGTGEEEDGEARRQSQAEEVDARQKNDAPTKDRLKEAADQAKRKANEKAGELGMREEWKEREKAHNERPSEAHEQGVPKVDSGKVGGKEEVDAQIRTGKKVEVDVDGDGKEDAQVGTGAPPMKEEGKEKVKEAGRPQDRAEAVRQGKQVPLNEQKEQKPETEEQHRVEVVFNDILKKSPSKCVRSLMMIYRPFFYLFAGYVSHECLKAED